MITPTAPIVETQSIANFKILSVTLNYDATETPASATVAYVAFDSSGNPLPAKGSNGTTRIFQLAMTAGVISEMNTIRQQVEGALATAQGWTGATVT